MNTKNNITLVIFAMLFTACQSKQSTEREQDFNFDWRFSLNPDTEAYSVNADDKHWKPVNLPHDWSVEFPFDSVNGEGCTGYLPGGIGWYRKHFHSSHTPDQKVFIHFDGIYNHSEVWINGHKLGYRPYGYVPFVYDLTPHLNPAGEKNVLAVKADHSRYADSRWYTGSGIYRNVKLVTTSKLYIPVWGTFVSTPVATTEKAVISIKTTLVNETGKTHSCDVKTQIFDPSGKNVGETNTNAVAMNGGDKTLLQTLELLQPQLWDIESPNLYHAQTTVICEGKVLDTYHTTFGIRSFNWHKDSGFYLNGKNIKIKGVCLHHDGGLVGAAVPKQVWHRRLQILKDGGCNAIRMSHNPASDELLDLCDEMGFLVQDEFFDEWDNPKDKRLNMQEQHDDYISRGSYEYFQKWAETDLKTTILAHRNHPSIFQWSIGNEIEWTYPRNKKATGFFDNMNWSGNYFWEPTPYTPAQIREEYHKQPAGEYNIESTAQKLAAWTRETDTTRPVIANCILPSASFETGYADALDIVGFSYRRVMYDYAKKNYPDKIVMGTENLPQWHEWKAIEERPFVSGTFLWTGIDYMGERNGSWPMKTLPSGLIDQAGFTKPPYHMYKTLWSNEPHLYLCSQTAAKSQYRVNKKGNVVEKKPGAWEKAMWIWYDVNEHWNYAGGEAVIVEVISNSEEVELFLNEESLGTKKLADFPDRIYKWALNYTEGTLTAKGTNGAESTLKTAGEAAGIQLSVDRPTLEADGYEVAHIVAQLVDANGNPVKHSNHKLEFETEGPVNYLGVDNGNPSNVQTFKGETQLTHNGRTLAIVQASTQSGDATVTVKAEGLTPAIVKLSVK